MERLIRYFARSPGDAPLLIRGSVLRRREEAGVLINDRRTVPAATDMLSTGSLTMSE